MSGPRERVLEAPELPEQQGQAEGRSRPLRIGMVSMHTSPLSVPGRGDAGGMNVYLRALAMNLGAAGHRVDIFTRAQRPDEVGTVELSRRVRVHGIRIGRAESVPKAELAGYTSRFGAELIGFGDFDVLHSHYWLSAEAVRQSGLDARVPHVVSFHTTAALKNALLAPGDQPEPPGRAEAEVRISRAASAIAVSGAFERERLLADYRPDPAKVHVVSPGVDVARFVPARPGQRARRRARLHLPDTRTRVVVCMGRIQPLKAQDTLIRALARIPRFHRPLLVLLGESSGARDDYYRSLLPLAERLGVRPWVRLVGAVSRKRLSQWYQAANLVAVPSYSETFGLVALEAAAAGLPVVASDAGGLRDSVFRGDGVLIPDHDPDAWAEAIRDALSRRLAETTRRSRAARAWALEHSWGATADRFARLYGSLLAGE